MSYRVYFGRLPDTLEQEEFEKLLEQYGKAKNIEWKSGYAYVDYKHGSDASKTVENLNGKEIGGNSILVELAQAGAGGYSVAGGFSARQNKPLPRPIRTPHRVRIENLSSRAKWMELKELLSLAGEVTFADTHKRRQGEGIVEFANRRDMEEAIGMFDKTLFFGRTIRLYDESPRGRSSSHRSRSRSPPRRRSSPSSKDRKGRSRSRSKSPNRKVSRSERRSDGTKKVRSNSPSPRRKPHKNKHSKSPSRSPKRNTSTKHRDRSKTPTKSSRHVHKKSKKSRKDVSRSRSRSPSNKKKTKEKDGAKNKRKQSHSPSSSDNENGSEKKKSKTKKKPSSSSESKSDSSSNEGSESDKK